MITAPELASAVKDMREAQNAFFKTKQFADLDKAKKAEKKVDGMVKQILTAQVPQCGKLF